MKVWIKRICVALVIVLAFIYLFLKFGLPAILSTDYIRNKVESEIATTIGRRVSLSIILKTSWALQPTLILSEIKIPGPSELDSSNYLAQIKSIILKLDVWKLIKGEVVFPEFQADTCELNLITSETGGNNWTFGQAKKDGSETPRSNEGIWLPSIAMTSLKDIRVNIHNKKENRKKEFGVKNATIANFNKIGAVTLTTDAWYEKLTLNGSAEINDIMNFFSGAELPLSIKVNSEGQSFETEGTIKNKEKTELEIKADANIKGTDLNAFLKPFNISAMPLVTRYQTTANFAFIDKKLSFNITDAKFDALSLNSSGNISFGKPALDGEIKLKATGKDLNRLLDGFGVKNSPPISTFRIEGGAHISDGNFKLQLNDSDFDGLHLHGEIQKDKRGDKPHFKGSLEVVNLNIASLFPESKENKKNDPPKVKNKYLISDSPIELSFLDSFLLDLKVKLKNFKPSSRFEIPNIQFAINIDTGILKIRGLMMDIFNGKVEANAEIGRNTSKLEAKADNLAFEKISHASGVRGGVFNLHTKLSGQGQSPRQIASSLNGTIDTDLSNVTLKHGGLFYSTSNLFDILNPLSKGKDGVTLDCIVGKFTVKNGVADLEGLAAKVDDVSILGDGNVDLKNETMSLGFVPKSGSVGLSTIIPPVSVSGSLASPLILPNPLRLATAQIDNFQSILSGTLGVVGDAAGSIGRLTGLMEREEIKEEKPDANRSCHEILSANSRQLTTLVGGLVFGTHAHALPPKDPVSSN